MLVVIVDGGGDHAALNGQQNADETNPHPQPGEGGGLAEQEHKEGQLPTREGARTLDKSERRWPKVIRAGLRARTVVSAEKSIDRSSRRRSRKNDTKKVRRP